MNDDGMNGHLINMIGDPDNVGKYVRLYSHNYYNVYNHDFLYDMHFNKRASKDSWDEFTSLSGIAVHEVADADLLKPWIDPYNKHLSTIGKRAQILSGMAPDVALVPSWEMGFLARNGLIIPLTEYQGLMNDYIVPFQIGEDTYGFMEPTYPRTAIWYDRGMVSKMGVNDPIDLHMVGGWDWDAFLGLLLTIKDDPSYADYDPMWGGIQHETAFMAANGVEFVSLGPDGRYAYTVDYRFDSTYRFLVDLTERHGVLKGVYVGGSMAYDVSMDPKAVWYFTEKVFNDAYMNAQGFSGGEVFMILEQTGEIFHNNIKAKNEINGIDLAFICAPDGPDAAGSRKAGGWKGHYGDELCYVIISGCGYPGAAAAYIGWALSDGEDHERRRKNVTDMVYGGSDELYRLGLGWAADGGYMNLVWSFGEAFASAFKDHLPEAASAEAVSDCQGALDAYVNAFLFD